MEIKNPTDSQLSNAYKRGYQFGSDVFHLRGLDALVTLLENVEGRPSTRLASESIKGTRAFYETVKEA